MEEMGEKGKKKINLKIILPYPQTRFLFWDCLYIHKLIC